MRATSVEPIVKVWDQFPSHDNKSDVAINSSLTSLSQDSAKITIAGVAYTSSAVDRFSPRSILNMAKSAE